MENRIIKNSFWGRPLYCVGPRENRSDGLGAGLLAQHDSHAVAGPGAEGDLAPWPERGAAPMAYCAGPLPPLHPNNPGGPPRTLPLSAGHGCMLAYSLLHLTSTTPLEERSVSAWARRRRAPRNTSARRRDHQAAGKGSPRLPAWASARNWPRASTPRLPARSRYISASSRLDLMEASPQGRSLRAFEPGRLIYLYDDNNITIEGPTSLAFSEDVPKRFESYGWHTLTVEDGNDLDAIERAIREAQSVTDRPSLISVKTVIGFGMPTQGTRKAHSDAPGEEAVRATKKNLGWPEDERSHPEEALAHFRARASAGPDSKRVEPLVEKYVAALRLGRLAGVRRRAARKLGGAPADFRRREGDGDARRLGRSHQRARPAPADSDRRLGRPRALEQHRDQGRREFPARLLRGAQPALRHPRARDGGGADRHRPARRVDPLRRQPSCFSTTEPPSCRPLRARFIYSSLTTPSA